MDEHKLFDESFYEGQRNAVYCKEHNIHASPYEIKEFLTKSNIRTKIKFIEEEVERKQKRLSELELGDFSENVHRHAEVCEDIKHLTTIKQTLLEELNK